MLKSDLLDGSHYKSTGDSSPLLPGPHCDFCAPGIMAHKPLLELLTPGFAQVADWFVSVQMGLCDSFQEYESRVPSGLHRGLLGGKVSHWPQWLGKKPCLYSALSFLPEATFLCAHCPC